MIRAALLDRVLKLSSFLWIRIIHRKLKTPFIKGLYCKSTLSLFKNALQQANTDLTLNTRQTLSHIHILGTANKNMNDSFIASIDVDQISKDVYKYVAKQRKSNSETQSVLSKDELIKITGKHVLTKNRLRQKDAAIPLRSLIRLPKTTDDFYPPLNKQTQPKVVMSQSPSLEKELKQLKRGKTYNVFPTPTTLNDLPIAELPEAGRNWHSAPQSDDTWVTKQDFARLTDNEPPKSCVRYFFQYGQQYP